MIIAKNPQKLEFKGRYIKLEALTSKNHAESLWIEAGMHDELWKYLLSGPYKSKEEFLQWIEKEEQNPLRTYYICVNEKGNALGALALINVDLTHGRAEIGGIFFGKKMQATRISTESVFLLLNYAFEELGMRRVEWRCNSLNENSKKAAERFDFNYEGCMKKHMISKGQDRDTLVFAMIDEEWPFVKKGFEQWLSIDNFDESGGQKKKLSAREFFLQ